MTLRISGLVAALATAAALLLPAHAALAQGVGVDVEMGEHDSNQPIEVTSKELRLDQDANAAIFTGDVVAVQGGMTLTSEALRVEYTRNPETNANDITRVIATGNVVMVRDPDVAESERAVYTIADAVIVMTKDVLVIQDTTVLSSDKLTYWLDTGRGLMEGNVKTLLVPESN